MWAVFYDPLVPPPCPIDKILTFQQRDSFPTLLLRIFKETEGSEMVTRQMEPDSPDLQLNGDGTCKTMGSCFAGFKRTYSGLRPTKYHFEPKTNKSNC
jgi:hypothetical protein